MAIILYGHGGSRNHGCEAIVRSTIGMLGNEKYSEDWSIKTEVYNKYYPGQLLKTYESGALSLDAEAVINKILKSKK